MEKDHNYEMKGILWKIKHIMHHIF